MDQVSLRAETIVYGKVLEKSETIVLPIYDTIGEFAYNEYYRAMFEEEGYDRKPIPICKTVK